jgi:hypothetical protein
MKTNTSRHTSERLKEVVANEMTIKAILVINTSGKPRLSKFYEYKVRIKRKRASG